jgi:dihydrodiol dehydrogenase / D-xylose 1-dehydrogenase (NADP)
MSVEQVNEYDPALGYHPSVIPLDIRLGITDHNQKKLRWGILGCSKVAHDFTQALKFLRSKGLPHEIVAVGSKSRNRAVEFANLHGLYRSHSYAELCDDSEVDIVYICTLHPYHRDHAEMALRSGKHVLVEKPMTMKSIDAQYLYDLGRELNLFVGEGMWTRFFPAVEWARQQMGEDENAGDPKIGTVRVVQSDFNIDGSDVGPYPTDSIYHKESGGGVAWCVLPYVVAASMLPFGSKTPERIAASGILPTGDHAGEVGDLAMGMTLVFDNDDRSNETEGPPNEKSIASGLCSYLAESSEVSVYAAQRGRITINSPAHCPTSVTIKRKLKGRGNGTTSDQAGEANDNNTATMTYPLPENTQEIEQSGGIRFPNSMGFIYEAEAVRRLIGAGYKSFPQWTPDESVTCLRIIEEMLKQVKPNELRLDNIFHWSD